MISSILSARWFRISAVVVVIVVGIVIGLPFLIQQQARIWLEENGGERVVIRDVDFNPFTAELVLEDLLIEVGTEELPPKALGSLSRAFEESVRIGLERHGLGFGEIRRFATPRRLAVLAMGLDTAQADQRTERKGPTLQAAYDEGGKPTKAALGFARSCGVDLANLETHVSEHQDF